jgi:uncharacterized Zn-finger protein
MNHDNPMFHPEIGRLDSPPRKRVRSDVYSTAGTPVVEQNTSYTRQPPKSDDEDERFLRLAREALVATATANLQSSELNPLVVDPTISDLLHRLQYALSPHGNPMKRGLNIQANENGQLMIQNFYRQFPNMSNDIFVSSNNHPANSRSEGWNFLVGEPLELRAPQKPNHSHSLSEQEHEQVSPISQISQPLSQGGSLSFSKKDASPDVDSDDQDRKFFCTQCSMSFRRSSDLKRHEKQHFKVLPYICEECGKSFARKDALKRHVGTLTCKRNTDKRLYVSNLTYLERNK